MLATLWLLGPLDNLSLLEFFGDFSDDISSNDFLKLKNSRKQQLTLGTGLILNRLVP